MQFITPTKEPIVEIPATEPQFDHTLYQIPTINPPLQQETPCNEAKEVAAPLEYNALDKADGCEANSFHLSQCNDHVWDLKVEDANDLFEFSMVNDEDDIDFDKETIDLPLSKFFKDCSSQLFSKDAIPTEPQAEIVTLNIQDLELQVDQV